MFVASKITILNVDREGMIIIACLQNAPSWACTIYQNHNISSSTAINHCSAIKMGIISIAITSLLNIKYFVCLMMSEYRDKQARYKAEDKADAHE
jgi:hypothetical protein